MRWLVWRCSRPGQRSSSSAYELRRRVRQPPGDGLTADGSSEDGLSSEGEVALSPRTLALTRPGARPSV